MIDRWLDWRDRLLSNPAFQRWAAAFPLTRPIARRHARELFDLVGGFVYSQILLACVRLRVFDTLAAGPLSTAELSRRLGLDDAATTRLMAAACALELAQRRRDGRYGLGRLGAPMVGNLAVASLVEHHGALYADLADPVALLRGSRGSHGSQGRGEDAAQPMRAGRLAQFWPYAGAVAADEGAQATGTAPGAVAASPDGQSRASSLSDAQVGAYSALMSASQPLVAQEILDAHDLRAHRCLLDVGGGEGRFIIRAAQHAPHLRVMLFDLPAVVARARHALAAAGLGERASVHGGDFTRDALPTGADVVSLVRVVHDHDDAHVLGLLRRVHAALPHGGAVLIAEPMAGTPGAQAMGDAYFGFYLLAMGRGQPRTPQRLAQLLAEAGFGPARLLPTRQPLQTQVLLAHARHPARPVHDPRHEPDSATGLPSRIVL